MDRAGGNIDLSQSPLPPNLPVYPDPSGDGVVTAFDALRIINEISQLPGIVTGELVGGEGEFIAVGDGVMASSTTVVGNALIEDALESEGQIATDISTVDQSSQKTSVFDSATVVAIDEIVDALAEDTAGARGEEEGGEAVDQLFASL